MAAAQRDPGGGILGLVRLLERHGEAIEADLRRFYHVQLGELFSGGLTWRQLGVYLRHLPRDSALAEALTGTDHPWDLHAHLQAATVDALRAGNWQRGDGKGRRPRPVPRPGIGDRRAQRYGRTTRPPEQVARALARIAPKRPRQTPPQVAPQGAQTP